MEIICKSRGNGKTTELIEKINKIDGYNLIICKDIRECQRLWKIIQEKEYKIPMPISFDDFLNNRYCGRNVNVLAIDNADLLLQYIARDVEVSAITLTKKEENVK